MILRHSCWLLLFALSVNVYAADPGSEPAEKDFASTLEKAKTEYEAKIKTAKQTLALKLKPLQDAATKRGDLEAALKLRDRIAELKGDSERPESSNSAVLQAFNGTWSIAYKNGHTRKYAIKDGVVRFLEDKVGEKPHELPSKTECRIEQRNQDCLVDFGDDLLEVIKIEHGRLRVDHYNPKQNYPDGKPLTIAYGIKGKDDSSDETK